MNDTIHNIIIEGRKKLSVSGVTEVDRFDENTVIFYTSMGELTVKGDDLRVNDLSVSNGEMNIEGRINSVSYSEDTSDAPLSFISRLFR